ncbi:hypothetical protein NDA11_003903 [Ustilago hordei]|uniref:Uncharacterized protein n=1 Tax=Ustilago hordei TaxID=120017 RepID=I2G5X5_USTHO|nr:uncharacterized protein UHO2_01923 [Ustilago hordei]KAJ1039203.1 hypothetical protein NDA10_002274 [Ustilago hordei]KAJ1586351.1 hypothetical protein NDA12_007181 [Ustilago hordei]KAJ1588896.1 hypothetical protein NDA15_000152 [Ustilago hordei]KAJ1590904.1 hypothetical protein NDA11_003903 [Ustilago hordei]KAJ1600712.1 hypothetical protein NDA14_002957 [Ustilago hordei]
MGTFSSKPPVASSLSIGLFHTNGSFLCCCWRNRPETHDLVDLTFRAHKAPHTSFRIFCADPMTLGWPDLEMPASLHARLLLWRDLAVHMLSKLRYNAIRVGLQNNHCPQLTLSNFMSDNVALVGKTITDAYYKCSQPKKAAFAKKWIDGGMFLQEDKGKIHFHLMSNTNTNARTNPAAATNSRTT